MVAKRIIPCLDVRDSQVVKGVQFKNHVVLGDIVELASYYAQNGADELVFYDITASCESRSVCTQWVERVAKILDIPFCVAGGITTLADAERILAAGADKISINTPALLDPSFITDLAKRFGQQCVVIGIDSWQNASGYIVCQYTGDPQKTTSAQRHTLDWVREVTDRGAGEITLNCMNRDGVRQGYDIEQLRMLRAQTSLPIIASGGAGCIEDFREVFLTAGVNGALAASVFHQKRIAIPQLKRYLFEANIEVRLCN